MRKCDCFIRLSAAKSARAGNHSEVRMKSKWQKVRLGDVILTNTSSYSENNRWKFVNYLDTGNITENKIDSIQKIYLRNEKLPSRARRLIQKNDIIYSMVRPIQRHYGILKKIPDNFMVSTGFTTISATEKTDPFFVYYYLTQNEIVEYLQMLAEQTVSTYPSIKTSDIENLQMALPPLPAQRSIAATLSCLDDKIELNRRINANLEAQAQAIFRSWFVGFEPWGGVMPENWRKGCLDDIIELFDFERIPLSSKQREKMGKNYPYYGAASLIDYVDDYLFDGIYLLLGEDGTVIDDFGFPVLQYVWGKFWVNNHAHILQGKNGFTAESLYILLKQTNVISIVTGAVQPKINQANLKALGAVIPSIEVMERFNVLIDPLFVYIRRNDNESRALAAIRDALLPKLMSGEIEVKL
jgi:type I restriction enzyme S subunit